MFRNVHSDRIFSKIANLIKISILIEMESSTDDNNISNTELKFEEAIDKLEQIVSDMEHNEVDLNSMIENYKEGMSLLKFCKKSIDLAELKVSEISTENSEQPTF